MIKEIENHRSVRQFKNKPIPKEVMDQVLRAGTRASTTGNMQVYSVVVTTSPELKAQLSPCHFNQPSVVQAGAVLTFCADVNRFSQWCIQRGAEPAYHNFAWFINASIDAILASQNVSLEAQAHGLGICYLGTTIFTADKIAQVLKLPKGVVPITTIVMGYPDHQPPLTDRLPMDGVVHYETYKEYTDEDIDRIWSEREQSEETKNLLEINNLPNLARIFTERRYVKSDNLEISRSYWEHIKKQGFLSDI